MSKKVAAKFVLVFLLVAVGGVNGAPAFAQEAIAAQTIDGLNVRSGPGTEYAVVATLERLAEVIIEGRSSTGSWVLVHTPDGVVRGWVATRYLITPVDFDLGALPVVEGIIPVGQAAVEQSAPATEAAPAPGDLTATVITGALNVRSGPGTSYASVGRFGWKTPVVIEGRSIAGDWILAHDSAGTRGWVAARYLSLPDGAQIASIPVIEEEVTAAAPAANVSPDVAAMEAQLAAVPIVPGVTARAREIFAQGQRAGRRPNGFAKIGDCNTESVAFLYAFDWGSYDLGPYSDLQPTIDYFSGSFSRASVAGKIGYSAVSAIDALWADPAQCNPGEASVYCEYRLSNASFAIMMFGANDISVLTPERYESALRQILDLSINAGVVPVLSTFTTDPAYPDRWAKALQLNLITVRLASEYDVPVMNFWLAARGLPAAGMTGDNAHLSARGGRILFNGDENQYGFTMRNLVTLQTLDVLRRELTGG